MTQTGKIAGANRNAGGATAASLFKATHHCSDPPIAALTVLAEELGRLLARREVAKIRNRRGYALQELLLGAFYVTLVLMLIARTLIWSMR